MNTRKIVPFVAALALALSACAGVSQPMTAPQAAAPTTAPDPTATAAPAQPTAAPEATATAMPEPTAAPAIEINNPPRTAEEVDAIELAGKNVTIKFWHRYSGSQVTKVLEIANDFNQKNPYGIKVELEQAGSSYDDVYNKINATIQGGGELPALSIAYQNQAAVYRTEGMVIDLTPFIQSAKYGLSQEDLADFFPYFLASDKNPQFPGEVLGWPTQRSMQVLYVNLDMLAELGATEPPKTLAELEELACKAADPAQERYGFVWRNDASDFASVVFANGGDILAPDASGYAFNSDAGVEALSFYKRLFEKGCAVAIPSSERFGEQNRFAAGKLLFVSASSTGLPFYASAVSKSEKPFKWTIVMHPQANPDAPRVNLFGASWSVLKTTPEQELAAWLFMKHFTEKENTAAWATTSNYMAVRQSAVPIAVENVKNAKAFADFPEAAEAYGKLYEWIQYGAVEAPVAGYDPVRKLISEVVQKVAVQGEGDPKEALDAAVEQANEILAEFAPRQ